MFCMGYSLFFRFASFCRSYIVRNKQGDEGPLNIFYPLSPYLILDAL